MAALFLARRLGASGFRREVAIKIVHPDLAQDPQFREMFIDEAMLSSRIQHPNVCQVEALGEVDGTHYLVMEFVHGCSLSQLQRALIARGRRLAPAFAVRIAMHVAEGLHAAHETCDEDGRHLSVVHRDVSPENILLAYAGHVKLIDFGIAKAIGRRHITRDGLLKGKFRYMSPEQVHGRPVDRRTDIYQLGIVLWEMLTLRRLFDAESDTELLEQVRAPKVPPPSTLVDRISPALDALVMSALDPDPERRPRDAQSFARMLGKAVPSTHEVDSGALSALLVALMRQERKQLESTYPPGLFEQMEQRVRPGPKVEPVFKRFTLTHDGEGPSAPDTANVGRARAQAEGEAQADEGAQVAEARGRRLVRMASGLRTTLGELGTSFMRLRTARGLWLVLSALALSAAFAALTASLRRDPKSVVATPRLPEAAHAEPAPPQAREPNFAGQAAGEDLPPTSRARSPAPALEKITPDTAPLVLTPIAPARAEDARDAQVAPAAEDKGAPPGKPSSSEPRP